VNNTGIEEFPALIIAKLFNFKHFDMLKFAAEELKDVDVSARFK
jgi:LemA protein